jgi:hypothetical protein
LKLKIVLYIIIIFLAKLSLAQGDTSVKYNYKNSVKVSVTQFFASEYRISIEHYFTNHRVSVALSPSYVLNKKPSIWLNQNVFVQLEGGGGNLQLKYHMFNKYGPIVANRKETVILDIYSAPYIQYFYLKYVDENVTYVTEGFEEDLYIKDNPLTDIINAYEAGIMFGVEIAVHQRFVMDFTGGAGYRYADIKSYPYNFPLIGTGYWSRGFTGLVPRMGVNFGFVF